MKHLSNFSQLLIVGLLSFSCSTDFLELTPRGTELESGYYQTEDQIFQGLIAVYDVLQWGGTEGWTMKLGVLNTASDDAYAGGSDASDQPSWVAYDNFTVNSTLGPQKGLWNKSYAGIYRANLILEKTEANTDLSAGFRARVEAEAKVLRAYYYFDLVRFFGDAPLILGSLGADAIYDQVRAPKAQVYAQIEQDLTEAIESGGLLPVLPTAEFGRITLGAAKAMLGKVILFQNVEGRMAEAAALFEEVIGSGQYQLEPQFGDIFKLANEFGPESVFEIQYSGNQRGGWGNFGNGTEGNYTTQFIGMRDYVGATYASGYGFCPVTEDLAAFMQGDPRFQHTIIDGNVLKSQGASYSAGYQNTDYFMKKYAPLASNRAADGEPALNWSDNVREIRFADVLLMAAEAHARSGNDGAAQTHLNRVRARVGLGGITAAGSALLDAIYDERRMELALEGHRFFDLVRTGQAASALASQGFVAGKSELLPIHQDEIDITSGSLVQNPGY